MVIDPVGPGSLTVINESECFCFWMLNLPFVKQTRLSEDVDQQAASKFLNLQVWQPKTGAFRIPPKKTTLLEIILS